MRILLYVIIIALFLGTIAITVALMAALNDDLAEFIGIAASLLGYFLAAYHILHELTARLKQRLIRPSGESVFQANWGAFVVLVLLSLLSVALSAMGLANLFVLLGGGVSDGMAVFIIKEILLPFLCALLLILLHVKVRANRMLDYQKHFLTNMASARNDWNLPLDKLQFIEPQGSCHLDKADDDRFRELMESVCGNALLAASATGRRHLGKLDDLIAVVFIADTTYGTFRNAAIAGGTPEYREYLLDFQPSFLDITQFVQRYNEYCDKAERGKLRRNKAMEMIDEFRDSVQPFASTAGLVYALERKLVFDNAYEKCMTTSFRFINELPKDQRHLFRFRQVIGIPISVFQKKVGVFLMFSLNRRSFYASDSVYWIIGDMIGTTIQLGISLGYFERFGLMNLLRNAPYAATDEELAPIIGIINSLRTDFSRKI